MRYPVRPKVGKLGESLLVIRGVDADLVRVVEEDDIDAHRLTGSDGLLQIVGAAQTAARRREVRVVG